MSRITARTARIALVGSLLLSAAGCVRGLGQSRSPFTGEDGPGEVRVRVENQNFNDATVHVRRGGERLRLGSVTGKSERNFSVRWDFTLDIQFEVALIGGGSCATRPMSVAAGEDIFLHVPTNIYALQCQVGK